MPQVIINISDSQIQRVIDGIAAFRGYQDTIEVTKDEEIKTIPNPQTKAEFAKKTLIDELKLWVKGGEEKAAKTAALKDLPQEPLEIT